MSEKIIKKIQLLLISFINVVWFNLIYNANKSFKQKNIYTHSAANKLREAQSSTNN